MRTLTAAIALGVGVTVAAAADAPPGSMTVFVRAAEVEERKEVDKATEQALKKQRDEARKARKELEKKLKQQHGKKREQWPAEAEEQYYLAEEAEAVAEANYEYRKIDPKGIQDSLQDLTESIRGKGMAGEKERVVLVGSPEEAELVVEVRARRSVKDFGAVVPSNCYTLFAVGPGPRLGAESFAAVPRTYRPKKFGLPVWRIASPRSEDPTFVFESYNGGGTSIGCHGAAANAAAAAIEKFIEDNHAALKGGAAAS